MKKLNDVINMADILGWNVEFEDGIFYFSTYSSQGQDFNMEIEANTVTELTDELLDYHNNFDVSYETYLWLDNTGHGKNGAPYDMIDVYKDMEDCKEEVLRLHYKLSELK